MSEQTYSVVIPFSTEEAAERALRTVMNRTNYLGLVVEGWPEEGAL